MSMDILWNSTVLWWSVLQNFSLKQISSIEGPLYLEADIIHGINLIPNEKALRNKI